ncbi:MAG TPA: peptidylprolyl isomerase [Ramlibacter sp.]|nr:peptidylprolyl isomerase [Ramlibacter sp.]
MSSASGCGGGACTCGGAAKAGGGTPAPVAAINGIALHAAGPAPDETELREIAWAELLRQEAVLQGLLPRHPGLQAPLLSPADHQVIEAMLDREVQVPQPTDDECRRYYEARQDRYIEGQLAHVRHILFAVTEGVDVAMLAARAEQALLELSRKDVGPGRFAALARELSNCPSGAEGGDLGWIAPHDCADELAVELFGPQSPLGGVGLRPRLVHTRYGFHIVEVLERQPGRRLPFDEVRERIKVQLAQQSRAKALHQYIRLLAGRALVEGVMLETADSPLIQ